MSSPLASSLPPSSSRRPVASLLPSLTKIPSQGSPSPSQTARISANNGATFCSSFSQNRGLAPGGSFFSGHVEDPQPKNPVLELVDSLSSEMPRSGVSTRSRHQTHPATICSDAQVFGYRRSRGDEVAENEKACSRIGKRKRGQCGFRKVIAWNQAGSRPPAQLREGQGSGGVVF